MNKEVSGEISFLDALNSRYCCLNEPLHQANDRRFLTSLRVYGTREDDEPQSLQTLSQHIIDPQILKKKITAALSALIFRNPHVLVQFWLPDTIRKHCMLTTLDQPFGIGVVNETLYKYRLESEQRMFTVDGEHIEEVGDSPGRVYRQKLPEWSLDTQGLPTIQNIRDSTACHDIHGYISLPVVDPASGCCVGVLELITLSKHVDYAFEVIEISKALKEQDLKTSNAFEEPSFCELPSEDRQIQIAKIKDILIVMCDTYNLPLAQTWELSPLSSHVSHEKSIQKSCSSFNRRCIGKVCMSTAGLPFYVRDLSMWEFHKACMEQHLEKSRGVVGRALLSHCASYCENVIKLSEEDYPLVRNACTNGLGGCFAIFLHGVEGKNDYVLEFFMPLDIKDSIDSYVPNLVQKLKLKIQEASGFEMGDISSIEVIRPPSVVNNISSMTEVDTPDGIIPHPLVTNIATIACGAYTNVRMQKTRDKGNDAGEPSNRLIQKIKRKRDSLTMEAVEKLFGQPMDVAIKSFGVSRSTFKRFLRDQNIPSWSMLKHSNRSACAMDSIQQLQVSKVTKRSACVQNLDRQILPIVTISCDAYANVSMQKTRDKGNDVGELSNLLIWNIPNIDSLTIEVVEKLVRQPVDEAFKSLGVSRSTLKRFLRDNSWSMSNQHFKHERSVSMLSMLSHKFFRWEICVESTTHAFHVEKRIVLLRMAHQNDPVVFDSTTYMEPATNNVDPILARRAMAHQNDPVVFDSTTHMEQATDDVDPLVPRTAVPHQNDPVVFDSTTYMEQATNDVDPLMPRTAMLHQNDPVVFDSTTHMEQATDDVDPLVPRTAMPHQNDPVVFDSTTYMEQATNDVDPLMDVDVTDLNFVDAFPTSSGVDFIDGQGSFLKMAGCSSNYDYLMEPAGIENPMAEIGMGRCLASPIGSGDMYSFGANPSYYDSPNLVFDDQLF